MTGEERRYRGAMVALTTAVVALGCNEATVSLFPFRDDTSAGSAGATQEPEPPDDGLVSHWLFDGNAKDRLTGNEATVEGGVTFVVDDVRGQVLDCDGVTGSLSFKNQTPLDFSYAVWLWSNLDAASGPSDKPLLWSNDKEAIDDFAVSLNDNRVRYFSYGRTATGDTTLTSMAWHHIVVTRKDGDQVAVYLDGQLDGDGWASVGPVQANPLVHVCGEPIGGRHFSGRLDDLRLYSRVLTANDVQALYALTLP